jgi:uncharacterized protein YbjT (DUF2867 family)
MRNDRVLVTGATGYIGGRLVPHLLAAGYQVRMLARDPQRLQGRNWLEQVEVAQGDVFNLPSLQAAMQGVKAAYYLVHSMSGSADFEHKDILAAENFGKAASQNNLEQVIYLGGLGDPQADLSRHLRSRQETGEALRRAGTPLTEFRAAIVVGAGSVSFEMIRYLTERLPVMVCPRWVYTRAQPIAIADVLEYLAAALETPQARGRTIEIGGADVLTYGDMMMEFARARGLRRKLLPVPVLTPRLSSYWVHIVTPIPASISRPLIDGLRNEVIVRDDTARRLFPDIQPQGYQKAVELALRDLDAHAVETSWSDALVTSRGDIVPVTLTTQAGMILERRQMVTSASPDQAYAVVSRLGGDTGWLYYNWAWRVRGAMDRLVGGVGLRRGRRDPVDLRPGDAVDFWRVEAAEPGCRLLLRAEMKVPGSAWLQFEMTPHSVGQTRLSQTAFFAPKGLSGLAYWYLLYPIHRMIFSGMIRKVTERAAEIS